MALHLVGAHEAVFGTRITGIPIIERFVTRIDAHFRAIVQNGSPSPQIELEITRRRLCICGNLLVSNLISPPRLNLVTPEFHRVSHQD